MSNPAETFDSSGWDIESSLEMFAAPIQQGDYFDLEANPAKAFRYPCCGFASELVERLLRREGVTEVCQLIHEINATTDNVNLPPTEHVLLRVNHNGQEYFIDPSYSQFFEPFGLDTFMIKGDHNPFPDERAIVFTQNEVPILVDWLCDVTRSFWQKHNCSKAYLDRHNYNSSSVSGQMYFESFRPPLTLPDEELRMYFEAIYDMPKYVEYRSADSIKVFVDKLIEKAMVDTSVAYL
jgi:hypothetical protein